MQMSSAVVSPSESTC